MDEPITIFKATITSWAKRLRQAARAYEGGGGCRWARGRPREAGFIARAFNQVELLKDATAHAENAGP